MIIVNNNSGQLCNKLILFAHAYATAIDTHQKVYHLYWFYSRHLFRESCRTDIGFFPGRLGIFYRYYDKYVTSKRSQRYDYAARMEMQSRIRGQILAKGVHRLYVIDAWEYRDYDALFRHRDIIVSVFRPTAEIEDAVERFWDSLPREDNTVIVGIHMRRGDYRVWMGYSIILTMCTKTGWKIWQRVQHEMFISYCAPMRNSTLPTSRVKLIRSLKRPEPS